MLHLSIDASTLDGTPAHGFQMRLASSLNVARLRWVPTDTKLDPDEDGHRRGRGRTAADSLAKRLQRCII